MLTQKIEYKDPFDESTVEMTAYFHVNQLELPKVQELFSELQELAGQPGEKIDPILSIVERLVKLSYGERVSSERGDRFSKSDAAWSHFYECGAYEAFVLKLFSDGPSAIVRFFLALLPRDVRAGITDSLSFDDFVKELKADRKKNGGKWDNNHDLANAKELYAALSDIK